MSCVQLNSQWILLAHIRKGQQTRRFYLQLALIESQPVHRQVAVLALPNSAGSLKRMIQRAPAGGPHAHLRCLHRFASPEHHLCILRMHTPTKCRQLREG